MKILYASSEASPFLRIGDLGDLTAALFGAVSALPDTETAVFLPCSAGVKERCELEFVTSFHVALGWRSQYCGILRAKGSKVYFIDNEYYFARDGLYGHRDDCERFAFFSKAVLDALYYLDWYPDIIHCTDWQTGLIPVFLRAMYQSSREYQPIRTVLTLLSLHHQGKAPADFFYDVLGLPDDWFPTTQFDGCTNFMKAAILVSDRLCALSPHWAELFQHRTHGCGLEEMVRQQSYKLAAIDTNPAEISFQVAQDYLNLYHSML